MIALVIACLALLVALIALGFAVVAWHRLTPAGQLRPGGGARAQAGQSSAGAAAEVPGPATAAAAPYLIYNPVKVERTAELEELAARRAADGGLGRPVWVATTQAEPGTSQARAAVAAGASVVVALGGDGTVRAVAAGLAGSDVPLGIVPCGTGNLLARNLEVPLDGLADQFTTAFTGQDRAMDMAWLAADMVDSADVPPTPAPAGLDFAFTGGQVHGFTVLAGVGFDAAMIEGVDSHLKGKLGWGAYVVSGVKNSFSSRFHARLALGTGGSERLAARTIFAANCGKLQGGVTLVKDAQLDDGWLDLVALDTRRGILGVVALGRQLLRHRWGRSNGEQGTAASSTFRRTRAADIRLEEPVMAQVDGEYIGLVRAVSIRIQPGALTVRVP
ncbi:diacylglycerol/lipid kinase family protein [Buchananella hordeovulneris]|uniref:DAGKc domain-containing protein n=1 Tax=Buchananella hordeovulneris TaxID=52770 RepID=A0A1Q5PU73_9ACTO|nr:diacylglycerol kinase family protein [Buchananella hordeovulneris]OKL51137.1 hypothetical protein BSZ40_08575 [Buchananella hordeovulneris]RRD42855.1 diacylglycerol kinase [Buchananella hordeovulneris]